MDADAGAINDLLDQLCELTGAEAAFLLLLNDSGPARVVTVGGETSPAAEYCRRLHRRFTEAHTVLSPTAVTSHPRGGQA